MRVAKARVRTGSTAVVSTSVAHAPSDVSHVCESVDAAQRPWRFGKDPTLRHDVGRIAALQHSKKRRDAFAVEAARHDVLEPDEIRRAVQRQAMPRDPAGHLHACTRIQRDAFVRASARAPQH